MVPSLLGEAFVVRAIVRALMRVEYRREDFLLQKNPKKSRKKILSLE
jgi:hypothetical protein